MKRIVVPTDVLLSSEDPWVRHRTRRDLLREEDHEGQREVERDPRVRKLAAACAWPGATKGDHRAAKDPLNKLCVLADLGVGSGHAAMKRLRRAVFARTTEDGIPVAPVLFPRASHTEWMFDVDGQDPLVALATAGFAADKAVVRAADALVARSDMNGGWTWPDARSPLPCRRPVGGCPYPTLKILRLLARVGAQRHEACARRGTDLILHLWTKRASERRYGFGFGTQFVRLRYPHVWLDVVHALEALSTFSWVWSDRRFLTLVDAVRAQARPDGLFVPGSVYLEWRAWCFGQKREPSHWLSLVIHRALQRGESGPEF